MLRCGKCGNQLTGEPVRDRRTGAARGYYACKNPHKALGVTRPCQGCSVPADDVHALVPDAIDDLGRQTPAARLAAARPPETAARRAELDARIGEAQDWLADLMEKRGRRLITPARYAQLEAEADRADRGRPGRAGRAGADRRRARPARGDRVGLELTAAEQLRTLAEAVQTPIIVRPGNGGGAARSAADRIELVPR